jgi:hypothetical protein
MLPVRQLLQGVGEVLSPVESSQRPGELLLEGTKHVDEIKMQSTVSGGRMGYC